MIYFELVGLANENLYVVPNYLNCNKWTEDFLNLNEMLGVMDTNKVLLIGDLNARIGTLEAVLCYQNRFRSSKDIVVNGEGRKLLDLCNAYGLSVVNGCTESDLDGNYTFIGGQGCSVVDYCLAGIDWDSIICNLLVYVCDYSDHLPLIIDCAFQLPANYETSVKNNLSPKLLWNKNNVNSYHNNTDAYLGSSETQLTLPQIDAIVSLSNVNNIRNLRKSFDPKKPWYDKECEFLRKQKLVWLNIWRKENVVFYLKEFHRVGKELKILCESKKHLYSTKLAARFCEARDSATFWKLAKSINGRKVNEKALVDATTFREHFNTLLNPSIDKISYAGPAPFIVIEELDREITMQELHAALKKAKGW